MKYWLLIFCISLLSLNSYAKTITVGNGGQYASLNLAANYAMPGDTILLIEGIFSGGISINTLNGNRDDFIVIMAETPGTVVFSGGSTAMQFSNCSYLRLLNLDFKGQTGNGVNIDDGGDYSTPTHNIIIENCVWHNMNASGNNDELKLSGLDKFIIRNCTFKDGSTGGSMIDMVGCHDGIIENCTFENAGSNCIQAKGGTENITIRYNIFKNGGQRSINIGGSTGDPYFRPLNAEFEAARILIHSNLFIGSIAPLAFVGAFECKAINNTIVFPSKWAIRILQENTREGIKTCSYNEVSNNIFFLNANSVNPSINIGANTNPESFSFSNNLWYNVDSPSWNSPNIPVLETNSIKARNPLFVDAGTENFRLSNGSPAIGNGKFIDNIIFDLDGKKYNNPPSIGAYEGNAIIDGIDDYSDFSIEEATLYPNPSTNRISIVLPNSITENPIFEIFSSEGKKIPPDNYNILKKNDSHYYFNFINRLPTSTYFLIISDANHKLTKKFLIK